MKVPFKTLLLLDNAPEHPPRISDVNVIVLPPNATALIQPTYQSVIDTFKNYLLSSEEVGPANTNFL